jgi:hypothetical protein
MGVTVVARSVSDQAIQGFLFVTAGLDQAIHVFVA